MISDDLLGAFRHWRRQSEGSFYAALRKPVTASLALASARIALEKGTKRHASSRWSDRGRQWGDPSADGSRWVENAAETGLRFVGFADEVDKSNYAYRYGIDHKGWFTDDEGDNGETLRGAVLQLPARNGRPQYLAAYADPNNDGAFRVDLGRGVIVGELGGSAEGASYDATAREAARAADSFAEQAAESERGYNRAWQAGSRYADLGHEIANDRREALQILAERRKVREVDSPTLCAVIVEKVERLRRDIQKARKQRLGLIDSIWSGYADAFNEGADETVIRA